jgi:hypothetical protein
MKNFLTFFFIATLVVAMTSFTSAQVSGDYGSTGNFVYNAAASNWVVCVTTGTWTGATTATSLPSATKNVWIRNGHTVTVPGTGTANCKDLNVESGGTLTADGDNLASANLRYVRLYGNVNNNGTLGTGTDGLSINLYYATFSGSNIKFAKIRPNVALSAVVTIAGNVTLSYKGSGLQWQNGTGLNITTVTVNSGAFLTTVPGTDITTASSNTTNVSDFAPTFNINGTVTLGDTGNIYLRSSFGSPSINISSTGSLTVSGVGGGVHLSTTTATNAGVISGAGSFTLGSTAHLEIVSTAGINGQIQTATQTLPTTASYLYVGSSAQVTGTGLPLTVGRITINNSSGVTLSQNLKVDTTITMTNGALSFGGNTLSYGATINFSYNGTITQTTGTELPATVNSFTVNNAAGVNLGSNLAMNGTLTFTSGKLTLGLSNLTLSSSALVSGGSASSYVVTNGAGVLTCQSVGATDVTFPVGTSSSYLPAIINNAGTVDNYSIKVQSTFDNAPVAPTQAVNAQWTINEGTPGGSSATLKLQWNIIDQASGFTPGGTVVVGRWNGSLWEEYSSVISGAGPYVATSIPITSFSPFMVGNGGALPIQLASFVGSYVGNNAKLEWSTVSELNNYGFNVQRLNNTTNNFETVGFVAGKSTTLEPQSYSFVDENASGSVEYRLEQIDNNGLKNYFGPIMLNPNSVDDNSVPAVFSLNQNYPNPFNPTTNITFSLANSGNTTLKVYNILGNEVATLFSGNAEAGKLYNVKFDATKLSTGMYIYRLQNGNSVEVKKLTLVK